MLRMHVEFWVFRQDPVVIFRTYQVISMLLSLLMLWNKLSTHVRWPIVGGRGHLSPKSRLKLCWMEHLDESSWCTISCKHDLLFGFLVDKRLDTFIKKALAPADMSVETAEQEVHQVGLAHVAES